MAGLCTRADIPAWDSITDGTDFYRGGEKLPIADDETAPTGLTEQDYIDALNELGVNVS